MHGCNRTDDTQIATFQRALALEPENPFVREQLAQILVDVGTRTKLAGNTQQGALSESLLLILSALAKYFEALEIKVDYAPAYYNIGVM